MNNLETFEIREEKPVKNVVKKSKKTVPKYKPLIVLGVLTFLTISLYFIYNNTNYIKPIVNAVLKPDSNSKDVVSKIPVPILNEVIYEFGSTLEKNNDVYVSNSGELSDLSLNLEAIPVDEFDKLDVIGEFEYKVIYILKEYVGKVIVRDTTPPTVVTKNVYVARGSEPLKPELFIRSITDLSKQYVSEITNLKELNLNKMGEYNVTISVKDINGNETTVTPKLFVLSSEYSNTYKMQDLNVSYNDKNDQNWDKTITEKFQSALTLDSALYKNALEKMQTFNWAKKIEELYPGSQINSQEELTLYNQNDLIVGLTKKVNLTYNSETKDYYLSY